MRMVGSGWVDLIVVGHMHMECNHSHIQLMSYLFFYMCMCISCAHLFAYLCGYTYVGEYAHACGGQSLTLGILLA